MLLARALVLALGDDVGELGQRLGDAAAPGDQDLAAVGDVADAVGRTAQAAAQAHEREQEHDGPDGRERPHPRARAAPGAAAAEDGRAAAASAAAPRAPARRVQVRSGDWVDRWVVTLLASASRRGVHVLRVRDFRRLCRADRILANETLMF